jgi:hypothetical protein
VTLHFGILPVFASLFFALSMYDLSSGDGLNDFSMSIGSTSGKTFPSVESLVDYINCRLTLLYICVVCT